MADRRRKLSTVVAAGDRRESLESLRDLLAMSIEEAEPESRASLAKQLRDVLTELASMEPLKESPKDELRRKREQRRAGATGVADPKVSAPAARSSDRGS